MGGPAIAARGAVLAASCLMTRTILVAFALLASSEASALVPEPDDAEAADYVEYEAYLAYPANGAADVPPNTRVFAAEVTAMQLVGPTGETVTCLLDPAPSSLGAVFEPMQILGPGAYHVLGVPSERAINFAGPGITVDIGVFTVGAILDEQAPSVEIWEAFWTVQAETDFLEFQLDVEIDPLAPSPLLYEVDLGDPDTLHDGTADVAAPWSQSGFFAVVLADASPLIEPSTATARVRAIDAAGNVGEWSAPAAFDLEFVDGVGPAASSCSAAPGRVPGAGGTMLVVLSVVVVGLAARRRRGGLT